MPVYDYVCLDCHKTFELVLSLNEHENEVPKCPECGEHECGTGSCRVFCGNVQKELVRSSFA